MDQVRRRRHPISIDDLDAAVNGGPALPDRSVLITFDDGHRSVLEHGLPILAERGLPGVAFVITGLLSTDTDFWWSAVEDLMAGGGLVSGYEAMTAPQLVRHLKQVPDDERLRAIEELERSAGRPPSPRPQLKYEELATLRSGGIAVGNHTQSHPCLNRCGSETISGEIRRAHTSLAEILGEPPRWFAYPNGDWDASAESILADLGYRLGFLFDHRMADSLVHPLRISRLRVNDGTAPDRFEIILSGLHPSIHRARGLG